MMEIAVHSDDLDHSVGVATPSSPPSVVDPVLARAGEPGGATAWTDRRAARAQPG
jgi:hypothetical protein